MPCKLSFSASQGFPGTKTKEGCQKADCHSRTLGVGNERSGTPCLGDGGLLSPAKVGRLERNMMVEGEQLGLLLLTVGQPGWISGKSLGWEMEGSCPLRDTHLLSSGPRRKRPFRQITVGGGGLHRHAAGEQGKRPELIRDRPGEKATIFVWQERGGWRQSAMPGRGGPSLPCCCPRRELWHTHNLEDNCPGCPFRDCQRNRDTGSHRCQG